MQANPDKFHVMLFSPTQTEQKVLQLCDGTSLMSETEVTVLGVTIDDRLCFLQHISVEGKLQRPQWRPVYFNVDALALGRGRKESNP